MKRLCCLLFAAICLTAMPLFAVDYTWNATSGYVNDPLNWLPNTGYPGGTASDNATIDNGGIATIDATHLLGGPMQQLTAGNTGSGAILQNGGDIVLNNGLEIARGAGSYGYYQLSAGTATATGGDAGVCNVMVGDYGVGVYSQTGGTMTAGPIYTVIGWHGGSTVTSQMSITGGSYLTNNGYILIGWGSNGIFNIGGTANVNTGAGGIVMTNVDTGLTPTAILNLGSVGTGGGILRTAYLSRNDSGQNYQSTVNFHGGTLQATAASASFLNVRNAYLYGEGATIDTNGFNETVVTPLDAPAGQGITGISLIGTGSGYIGEPMVSISGDGSGATARAILNGSGGIDHIQITNPGTGYSTTPTITITGGGGTAPAIDSVSLANNVSGGLTKTGLGNLTLNTSCTYTGPTVVNAGKLTLAGIDFASPITVKNAGTLAGYTKTGSFTVYPTTTVETGGTLAPSAVDAYNFDVDSLNLADDSTLHFTLDALGYSSFINVSNNVAKVGTDPITVNVSYSGTPINDVTVLQTLYGSIDGDITFALPGGLPTYDSTDAIHGAASIYTDYANGFVQIKAAGVLTDVVPTWNDLAGGDWNDTGNWGTAPPNPYPQNSGDRAMFVRSLGAGTIPVNLNVSPTLSSMIFDSPMGESYQIDPSDSGKSITLDSSIAKNWYIAVLSGSHTVNADIAMAAGDGQALVKVPVASHLTLGGSLGNLTTAAGFTFQSTGTLTGNQWDNTMAITHGVLTLGGNSSFTGPLTMTGYGRLEMLQPTSLGTGTAALTLDGQLAYLGAPATPTTVTIDRNVVFAGAGFLNGVEVPSANVNLNFTGSLSLAPTTNAFRKTGAGTLTFSNAGTNTLPDGDIQVEEGALKIENGTFDKARVNIYFQNGAGDFFIADTAGKSASLTVDKGATLTSDGMMIVGANGAAGTLNVTGDSQVTIGQLAKFGVGGTAYINVDGTSAELHSTLTCLGANWLGGRDVNPALAVVNLTGYGEMHNWGDNTHMGSGAGNHVSFNVSDHAKFVFEGTNTWAHNGVVDIGDYGSTADVVLNDFASFENPHGYVTIGGNIEVAYPGGTGTVTLNDSATFTSGRTVCIGDSGATGVLTLNGGVVTVPALTKGAASVASTINFNGGTLKASTGVLGWYDAYASKTAAGLGNFIQGTGFAVNVLEGGAKIDSNGLNVTIGQQFQHAGTAATDGGLTKLGPGSLTLFSKSNYSGPTVVNDGTLKLATNVVTQLATTPDNAAGDRGDGPYALGRDFSVSAGKTIQVTQLGVFDSLGDGLEASHIVHISSTDGATNYAVETVASGTANPYQRGFRFIALGTPLSLSEGNYRVWVESIGGAGNDAFSGNLVSFDAGNTGAVSIGGSYYNVTTGLIPATPWNDGSGNADADATFSFYDPSGIITANALPVTTPVLLGGATGSTPKLDLQGVNQQIASLADVAGAEVMGVVTNSLTSQEVALTLGATSGTTTYGGSIEGNLSLVKTGASNQVLSGSLTYTGNTDILAGELAIAGTANLTTVTGSSSGVLHVCDGATLTASSIELGTLVIGGAPPASAASVPEPCTLALLALAVLGLGGMSQRKRMS